MASASPLKAALSCSACRHSVWQSICGSALLSARAAGALPVQPRVRLASRASTSFSTFRHTAVLRAGPAFEESRDDDAQARNNSSNLEEGLSGNSDTPWYMQVEPPRHPTLIHEAAPLPEVPEAAPDIMKVLLDFVADDLGLDKLSLLDLRGLDPPAALGPRLLMLFGTARSERHLHVSAGRCVRWLKAKGLSAHADGLLGRNELKTRLRRKMRKERMLGASRPGSHVDDGISTGWICVNLGTVGTQGRERQLVDAEGRISGFGNSTDNGMTIVVQMMVESKRAELDLENFWSKQLRKSQGNAAELERSAMSPEQELQRLGQTPASYQTTFSSQRRYFSTSIRQNSATGSGNGLSYMVQAASSDPRTASEILKTLTSDVDEKLRLLGQMEAYVRGLPAASLPHMLELTDSSNDNQPSAFLRLFDRAMENLPATQTWGPRLWLQVTARTMGIAGYNLGKVRELVREMQILGIEVTRQQCCDLIQAIFAQPSPNDAAVREQSMLAMNLIDTMFERGQAVLSQDIIVTLIESLVRSGVKGTEATRLRNNFEFLLEQADLPCLPEELLVRLLGAYASEGNWDRFWKVWRIPPKNDVARSSRLYAYIYRLFAGTNHQSLCMDAVRRTFHEMLNEEPPVQVAGPVSEALKACVRIADPEAEGIARNTVVKGQLSARNMNRDFVKVLTKLESIQQ